MEAQLSPPVLKEVLDRPGDQLLVRHPKGVLQRIAQRLYARWNVPLENDRRVIRVSDLLDREASQSLSTNVHAAIWPRKPQGEAQSLRLSLKAPCHQRPDHGVIAVVDLVPKLQPLEKQSQRVVRYPWAPSRRYFSTKLL